MSHKADESFFKQKRPWSERKDAVLSYYLKPYLAMIARRGKPILIVDGFAGRGKFEDGKPGSPLIIAGLAQAARLYPSKPSISCWFIDTVPKHCEHLRYLFRSDSAVVVKNATFLSIVSDIEDCVRTHSVFLYLDPFTVNGLQWEALDRLFCYINEGDFSVEVLLNFNADSFCRRGRAALKLKQPEASAFFPDQTEEPVLTNEIEALNGVVGGCWWQDLLNERCDYPSEVDRLSTEVCDRLRRRFAYVFRHDVRELERHRVPKYVLVFASRHPNAVQLINDAMCSSRDLQACREVPSEPQLFESRPEKLIPDMDRLDNIVLQRLVDRQSRKQLVESIIQDCFCAYSSKEIRDCVKRCVMEGLIQFQSRTGHLNEEAMLWRTS